MSDHLVRLHNLKLLQRANGWDDSELARRCERSPQQVHAWKQGTRHIGERLARKLEEALGLNRYALDDRAGTHVAEPPPKGGVPAVSGGSAKSHAKEMPIIRWAQLSQMLNADNATLKAKAVHLGTYAPGSARSKFVEVPDDSMAPQFQPGDHVLLDPTEAPRAGDVVLVSLPAGEHYLRVFRPRTAHIFEAVALNPHYQALSSDVDQTQVCAVMVEHRSYRRTP